jgi:hypothetical protein
MESFLVALTTRMVLVVITVLMVLMFEHLAQVGGGIHHERPATHQQGVQVEHLHRPAVPPLPQV